MLKRLTQNQIDDYRRDRFVHPVKVMSGEEADIIRERLEDIEQRYPKEVNSENRNNSHLVFKCLDEVAHHLFILDVVEDLIGPNILVWGAVLFIKEPQTKAWADFLYKGATWTRAY